MAGKGGPRPGAGRPPKTGAKATTNGTIKTKLKSKDGDPLDFLLKVMDNVNIPLAMRMTAASTALPFLMPRLAAQTVEVNDKATNAAEVDNARLKAIAFTKAA